MSNELKPISPTDDAIRKIAMEAGKQVVHHIETMYGDMTKVVAWKSARKSIRNTVHNAIIAAVHAADEGRDAQWIERNERHRKEINRMRKVRV